MNYFLKLDFFESVKVFNELEKRLENNLTKEFVVEILNLLFAKNNKAELLPNEVEDYF